MKNSNTNSYSAHQDVFLLLPWYANKTLQGSELKLVDNHLKVCLICKRELVNIQKLSLAVNAEGSFDSAALASFNILKSRIHKIGSSKNPEPENLPKPEAGRGGRYRFGSYQYKLGIAAALILAILIPGYLSVGKLLTNDYRTLSDGESSNSHNDEIKLVFSKNANSQQIGSILANIQGQIIGGPTEQSVYTVRINKAATRNVIKIAELLRNNPYIIFAEPSYAILSSGTEDGKDSRL